MCIRTFVFQNLLEPLHFITCTLDSMTVQSTLKFSNFKLISRGSTQKTELNRNNKDSLTYRCWSKTTAIPSKSNRISMRTVTCFKPKLTALVTEESASGWTAAKLAKHSEVRWVRPTENWTPDSSTTKAKAWAARSLERDKEWSPISMWRYQEDQ